MALTGRSLRVADVTPLCRETQRESQAVGRNAASICAAPLAVFLPAGGRGHWFARGQAGGAPDAAIAEAICALAMTHTEGFVEIPDLLLDERFVEMELVASSPWLRSFAGVPLEVGNRVFGAICVFDFIPKALSRQQRLGLESHARGVAQSMERQRAAVAPETPRTQAERQAALSSAALANARDAVLIFSLRIGDSGSPKIAYANDAFARMTGTDALAALGGPATSIAPRLRDAYALDRAAAAGLPLGGIVTFPGAAGTTVEAEMTVATMPSTGGEHHWVAVLRDPSGRYRAERGEREAFAAGAHRAALAIHEDRMRALFDRTPAIVFTLDRDLRIRSTLGGGLRAIGFTADSAIGTPIEEYLLPAQCDAILTIYRQVLTGKSASYEHAIFNRTFQTYVEPSWDEAGRVDGVAAVAFDVTDRELAKRALAASHEHLARTERTAQVGSWLHDVPGDRLSFSDELVRLFSVGPDASREALFGRVVADDLERARLEYAFAYASMKATTLEYRIAGTKAPRWIRETIEFATDDTGRLTRVDGIVVDITDRRSAEAEIARLADTDDVTGLPNRAALATRIDRALFGSASGDRSRVKLLLVDLDRFQATADAFGRKIGDRLLREAARRLTEIARDGFVARLDGHGFAVLFAASDDAARVAKRLHGAFRSPFEIDAGRYVSTVSVGIASGEPKETADDLLRRGESTLAAAKLLGGNRTVDADDEAAHAYRRRKAIDLDLRGVLDRNDLHLVFQPIVNVRGKVTRLEALLRWNHEIFGAIAPSEFVPIAEENGEIVPIGRWVLRTACRHLRNLRAATGSDVRVAVNVSPAQFSDPTLMSTIGDALESAGLEPEALEIEITESTVMSDPLRAAQLLTMIRATGVTVSIDDFGTGYSSLASLQRLPIDSLKIDKSFIAAMPEDAEACAIVDAILALARQLSLEVVAEGVETVEQAAFLRERGCPLLQGFYFARPDLPATMLTLARHPDDAWTSRGPALASTAVAGTPDGDVRRCHLHVRTA